MNLLRAIVLLSLACRIYSSEEHGLEQGAEQLSPNINAVLALVKSSFSRRQIDKVEVLKNAMILLSEVKSQEQVDLLLEELMELTLKAMEDTYEPNLQCTDPTAEEVFTTYADRHARRLEGILDDYDCMEREFDVSADDFDPEEAALVFNKCRLLVLRNVIPKETMREYRIKYDNYIYAIHTGKIDRVKTKTTDSRAADIVQDRGTKRHDVILPRWLGGQEIFQDPKILDIMSHEKVLGPEVVLSQVSSVISEPGAPTMHWHDDMSYLWTGDSFEVSGIGGHDLPPYSASVFVSLVENTTYAHGPTEFCMGSSHLSGIPMHPPVLNETLIEEGRSFHEMQSFRESMGACPPDYWRVPLVDMGDAVVFDYQITHRGGPNESSESRALLYGLFNRYWFRDSNFDATYSDESGTLEKTDSVNWNDAMRYALVDTADVVHDPKAKNTVSHIKDFAGMVFDEPETGTVEFPFTNYNVEGVSVSLDGEHFTAVAPKEQWLFTADIGAELSAHQPDGTVIKKWTIEPSQHEIVLVDRT